MAVTDLQTWADQLELVRLPTIKDDIASLTASQAVYASNLSAKAQELSDRLDAHAFDISAAQTDATAAGAAASAVSTEVYDARLDAATYTNQKFQEALNAIDGSNADIRAYIDGNFSSYLQGLISDSDALLLADVNVAKQEAFNARDFLNGELTDINAINDQILNQEIPAINQDAQDSLIRLVGLEYFNEEMFGGMEFPNIQALHDKLKGEVLDATEIASKAANDPDVQNLLNDVKIDNAITAARSTSHAGQTVVAFEESGDNAAAIITESKARVDEDIALAGMTTQLRTDMDDDFALVNQTLASKVTAEQAVAAIEQEVSATYNSMTALASATQSAKATTDGIQAGFAWRLNDSNVMEMFSVSDGSGGVRKTAKLDFDYVQITGLTQIDSGVITDLVADTAFVDNLTVGRLNIAGNAVSFSEYFVAGKNYIGDGGYDEPFSEIVNAPPFAHTRVFFAVDFEHGYEGQRDWGFKIQYQTTGTWIDIKKREVMTEMADYSTVTGSFDIDNSGNPTTKFAGIRVLWRGEAEGVSGNKITLRSETTLTLEVAYK